MAVESKIPTYLDALRLKLLSRAGLSDVDVYTGWIGDNRERDSIQLLSVTSDTNWGMLGNRRIEEEFVIDGVILAYSRLKGEDGIKACRDRIYAIFNEVIQQVREDPANDDTARVSLVSRHEFDQSLTTEKRVAKIEFQITASGYLIP